MKTVTFEIVAHVTPEILKKINELLSDSSVINGNVKYRDCPEVGPKPIFVNNGPVNTKPMVIKVDELDKDKIYFR